MNRRRNFKGTALDVWSAYALSDGTLVIASGTKVCTVPFGKPIRARWTEIGEHYFEGTMKRREAQSNEQGKADQCKLSSSFPLLFEFLTETSWDDGKPRETGTVLLFIQEGRWKACLNDRDADASAFVSARTLSDLLAVLNDAVIDPSVEWRERNGRPNKRR